MLKMRAPLDTMTTMVVVGEEGGLMREMVQIEQDEHLARAMSDTQPSTRGLKLWLLSLLLYCY